MRAPIDFPKPFPKPFPPKPTDLKTQIEFALKDKDGSGSINSEEYGPGKMQQDRFRKADANHDGKLSYDEYKASKNILVPYHPIEKPFPILKAEGEKEITGAGAEKTSWLKKALPFLALTNPITAPIGVLSFAKKLFD